MARYRNHIQNSLAEIIARHLAWPVPKTKEGLNCADLRLHYRSLRQEFQIFVTGDVITVAVRVSYDQRNAVAIIPLQPLVNLTLYHPSNVGLSRARIKQKSLLFSEEQVEKRLLIIRAPRFTQDIEIRVVLVYLIMGFARALRAADLPTAG